MSLFGFGDITFNKQDSRKNGPLSALEGTDFEKNTFHSPGIYYFTIESAEYKSTLKMVKFD